MRYAGNTFSDDSPVSLEGFRAIEKINFQGARLFAWALALFPHFSPYISNPSGPRGGLGSDLSLGRSLVAMGFLDGQILVIG